MRRISGMTLIELMMVVAVIALLAAISLPSYQRYQVRGIRSQGQQFLMDIAQAQEQYFLDNRSYATDLGAAPLLNRSIPPQVSGQYDLTRPFAADNAATPPTFMLVLTPKAGSSPASQNDGALIVNNLLQRWREVDGNFVYSAGTDCTWEATSCVAQ